MSALEMMALADSVLTWLECGAWWGVVQVKCAVFLRRKKPRSALGAGGVGLRLPLV
jgi:hypothetical protein